MTNDAQTTPGKRKSIMDINVRYTKSSLIPRNPNPLNEDESIVRVTVPQLMQHVERAIQQSTFPVKTIHTLFQLRQLSEKKKHLRPQLAALDGFVENLCKLLVHTTNLTRKFVRDKDGAVIGTISPRKIASTRRVSSPDNRRKDSSGYSSSSILTQRAGDAIDGLKRCQQHAMAIINSLLLVDPEIDAYIIADSNCLVGLGRMLNSTDAESQELAGICLDYLSVTAEHKTMLCTSEDLMRGIVHILHNTDSIIARTHVLQALACLSEDPDNRFVMAREPGMLNALSHSFSYMDESPKAVLMVMNVVYNMCQLKENVPLVERNTELKQRIAIIKEGMEQIISERDNSRHSASDDNQDNSEQEANDAQVMHRCHFVTSVISLYQKRTNSDAIIDQRGWWMNKPIVIGGGVCASMMDRPYYRKKFKYRIEKELGRDGESNSSESPRNSESDHSDNTI